jgi:hypothetical protein
LIECALSIFDRIIFRIHVHYSYLIEKETFEHRFVRLICAADLHVRVVSKALKDFFVLFLMIVHNVYFDDYFCHSPKRE